jgi:hypothetical protein
MGSAAVLGIHRTDSALVLSTARSLAGSKGNRSVWSFRHRRSWDKSMACAGRGSILVNHLGVSKLRQALPQLSDFLPAERPVGFFHRRAAMLERYFSARSPMTQEKY